MQNTKIFIFCTIITIPCPHIVEGFPERQSKDKSKSAINAVKKLATKKKSSDGDSQENAGGILTLDVASKMIHSTISESKNRSLKMNIAVVDSGSNLVTFARMDGAWLGSIDVAIKKAKTAVFFDMSTKQLGTMAQPGKSLFGIEQSNDGLILFPGGLPVHDQNGKLIGGIGVSGDSVENDQSIAAVGLKSFKNQE